MISPHLNNADINAPQVCLNDGSLHANLIYADSCMYYFVLPLALER